MVVGRGLPAHLLEQAHLIEAEAHAVGLDFFEVVFEMLDARDVNAVAAYGGFPVRYSSWRFGMDFERLQKGYEYGLSKIYELVINNDPTIAYLVRSNSTMEQKLVMAHVFGHADFFKHNVWFSPTDRHMVDTMTRHAERMREIVERHGQDRVEEFLDLALSLDTLIDPYMPMRERQRKTVGVGVGIAERARRSLEALMGELESGEASEEVGADRDLPTYDVLGFLTEHAPLLPWQRDVLRIVREEAYYFAPQRMTKIINEGWASFWHSRILTSGVLDPSEIVEFADCHSGATAAAPGQLNPYKMGIELFRHAEARGEDIFQLRAVHNDVSFVDAVIDEEFADRNELFVFQRNARTGRSEVAGRDWEEVKAQMLRELTWGGQPQIELVGVTDGELQLLHRHEGRDIKLDEAGELLRQIARLWSGRVILDTVDDSNPRRLVTDGETVKLEDPSRSESEAEKEQGAGLES